MSGAATFSTMGQEKVTPAMTNGLVVSRRCQSPCFNSVGDIKNFSRSQKGWAEFSSGHSIKVM